MMASIFIAILFATKMTYPCPVDFEQTKKIFFRANTVMCFPQQWGGICGHSVLYMLSILDITPHWARELAETQALLLWSRDDLRVCIPILL